MSVESKTLPNGRPNPSYVDLLDEDPPIAGQKFACVSFVSPEKLITQREHFMFDKFVRGFDLAKSLEKFQEFINFIAYKYSLDVEKVHADFNEFSKEETANLATAAKSTYDDYKTFAENNEESITQEWSRAHDFQTSVRGLKIRGSFPTQEEAELGCKRLRERDPSHDIFVAPVGLWLPWDPDAYKTGRVEHMEPELNRLMQEKASNEVKAKTEFDERVKAAKRKAIEENIRKATESGNKSKHIRYV
jgi:hypothetical protein